MSPLTLAARKLSKTSAGDRLATENALAEENALLDTDLRQQMLARDFALISLGESVGTMSSSKAEIVQPPHLPYDDSDKSNLWTGENRL